MLLQRRAVEYSQDSRHSIENGLVHARFKEMTAREIPIA